MSAKLRQAKIENLRERIGAMGSTTDPGDIVYALSELAELIDEISQVLSVTNDTARHAANTASCLANGIQPD